MSAGQSPADSPMAHLVETSSVSIVSVQSTKSSRYQFFAVSGLLIRIKKRTADKLPSDYCFNCQIAVKLMPLAFANVSAYEPAFP